MLSSWGEAESRGVQFADQRIGIDSPIGNLDRKDDHSYPSARENMAIHPRALLVWPQMIFAVFQIQGNAYATDCACETSLRTRKERRSDSGPRVSVVDPPQFLHRQYDHLHPWADRHHAQRGFRLLADLSNKIEREQILHHHPLLPEKQISYSYRLSRGVGWDQWGAGLGGLLIFEMVLCPLLILKVTCWWNKNSQPFPTYLWTFEP